MMSVEELAAVISHSTRSSVELKRIGRERWQGLCPFHHEKSPSFQVWRGRRGEGRYHCHGCGADGDADDWMRKVEGKAALPFDRRLLEQHKQEQRRARQMSSLERRFYDRYPDAGPDWQWFLQGYVAEAQGQSK